MDTGAEVKLVRTGLIPPERFREAERPLKLIAANNQRLPGGSTETTQDLIFKATDLEIKCKIGVTAPTMIYEVEIEEDIIMFFH